jgi:glycosyltransferase involved in cell wall biosynthesis
LRIAILQLKGAPKQLHIITVTFNNERLLVHQIKLLQKNLKDDFELVVVDNSTDKIKRQLIKEFCLLHGILYFPVIQNPYYGGSESHAYCLNWSYRNYIQKIRPRYFGFIDHDAFPVNEHSLISVLQKQQVYGHLQSRGEYWYLWAGLCFYRFESVKDLALDFMPGVIQNTAVDTGGLNWEILYKHLDRQKLLFPAHSYIQLREGEVIQSDKMERLGDWLHSFNGSNWMQVKSKDREIDEYLQKLY